MKLDESKIAKMANQELGHHTMGKIIEEVEEFAVLESSPRMEGRNLYIIVAPKN